ncbi:MAG: hypothetical protein UU93_C0001G0004 [Candidatus Amesbacteria bacterium GW2011_GWA2_42_12]|uniref:M23ase beta-sheet core domain-containing protein n=1 Tax=Candidatus Amesbacteria bacterium GW2011_GWA2_42_12 TaxID=1618356 RepID=A0A0G1B6R3_9BACT|nr:MAG: hypothetical protein UU93_C0001G0004 [Candidatus Amesbacteria bacterium GW2011_GWA2_42_12]
MIDLFAYQVAESARNIIYERQRYLEGASAFWDPEREAALNDLLELFRSEGFTPHLELPTDTKNPSSLEKMLSYLQGIIDDYNEVAVPNIIPPSVREAYEKHLAQLELENKNAPTQKISLFSSSLKAVLPSASPELIKEVSLLIVNTTNQQGVEVGLEQAVHILSNVSKITSTPLDNSTIALALTPLSPNIDSLLGTNSPDLSHQYALVSSVLFGEVKTLSPQAISSLPLKVSQIQTLIKDLTGPLFQLNSLYQNSKQDLHTATGILASLIQSTSKLDTPNPTEKLVLAQTLFEISPLINYVYHNSNSAQKATKFPASQTQFQEFLVHMGLDFAGTKGFQASSRSISAAISASLGTIFTPSAQTYYAGRATSSPYFKQFLVAYEAATAIGTSKNAQKTSSKPSRVSSNSFNQSIQNIQEQLSYLFSKISSFGNPNQKDNIDLTDPVLNIGMLAGSIGLILVPILIPAAPLLLVPIGGAISIFSIHRLITITTVVKHSPAQTFNNFITNVFAGVVAMLSSLFLFIGIVVLSIPIVIALILFIINTSAFVVPPNMYTASSSANLAYTGPLPEGCPVIWPVKDSATINQGAWVPDSVYPNASHKNTEAIDIGVAYKQVFATHNGVAFPKIGDGGFATYGNFVDVYSTCNYKNIQLRIISRYSHLSSFLVAPNTPVQKGQPIAISGNSGGVPLHLHYEFRQDNGSVYGLATNLQTDTAPFMWPEYIPSSPLIPRGCWSYNDTGAKLPCKIFIP